MAERWFSKFWQRGGEPSNPNVRVVDAGDVAHVIHTNPDGTEMVVPTSWDDLDPSKTTTTYNPQTGQTTERLTALDRNFHGDPCDQRTRDAGGDGYTRRR